MPYRRRYPMLCERIQNSAKTVFSLFLLVEEEEEEDNKESMSPHNCPLLADRHATLNLNDDFARHMQHSHLEPFLQFFRCQAPTSL